jgi:hypothetical protein
VLWVRARRARARGSGYIDHISTPINRAASNTTKSKCRREGADGSTVAVGAATVVTGKRSPDQGGDTIRGKCKSLIDSGWRSLTSGGTMTGSTSALAEPPV